MKVSLYDHDFANENFRTFLCYVSGIQEEQSSRFTELITASTNCYLSGSSILAFSETKFINDNGWICDEKSIPFLPSDLDIYVHISSESQKEKLFEKLEEIFGEKIEEDKQNRDYLDVCGFPGSLTIYSLTVPPIERNTNCNSGFKFQIICNANRGNWCNAYKSFDIDICRKRFDGKTLISLKPIGQKHFSSVLARDKDSLIRGMNRIIKYVERGYKFEEIQLL